MPWMFAHLPSIHEQELKNQNSVKYQIKFTEETTEEIKYQWTLMKGINEKELYDCE